MSDSRAINYRPPLSWVEKHSAENGVACAELRRREDEGEEKLSMTSHGMTLEEALEIVRKDFEKITRSGSAQ